MYFVYCFWLLCRANRGSVVIRALFRLESGPLDGQPVVGQPERRVDGEVLGVPLGESVAITLDRYQALTLELPPVRGGRGAFALVG